MKPFVIVMLIVLVVIIAALIGLAIYGRKLQKKSEQTQAQMKAGAQSVSILVIDKKRMKLKEANLPKIVLDQTPKYLRNNKVPIVKAKIGPKIMTLMCDDKIFDLIPIKKEIKAVMNGIYIMDVKGLRSNLEVKPEKQKFFQKIKNKITNK
jgi:L-cystine uptake protein TcyP (sodium:dicarboxylate symporter family)